MKFTVITTCNEAGWKAYGRRMAENWAYFWTLDASLAVYSEGFNVPGDLLHRVENRKLPAWLDVFKARHADDPFAHGRSRGGAFSPAYDFRTDAIRFSHKIAAICDAADHLEDGILIWLDADTNTHCGVTAEWIEGLFPGDACLAWPDRENMYPECGVLMFRVKHPKFRPLMHVFRDIYESDLVFNLPQTHDSFVLQHVVNKLAVPWQSLSGYARNSSHPIATGPMSQCLDHLKGNRKSLDHSPEHVVLR